MTTGCHIVADEDGNHMGPAGLELPAQPTLYQAIIFRTSLPLSSQAHRGFYAELSRYLSGLDLTL